MRICNLDFVIFITEHKLRHYLRVKLPRPLKLLTKISLIHSLVSKESKCSSRRGCPARKHVERSLEDPSMLVVAYEEEHSHSKIAFQSPSMMLHI